MIASLSIAFVAIVLIGVATPRQASHWLGRHIASRRRRDIRFAGFALLLLSLAIIPGDAERARAIVTWIGGIGMEGLAVALVLALHPGARRSKRHP
ncbi:MAG: DUF3325 family protein [Candidatus Sphingomonas colombiensis]|nr:DUF3325 family protein [Sphingomonas sp.]WEK43737.1 MAG: DUF3325 family protein [Sphingomonas sp.]